MASAINTSRVFSRHCIQCGIHKPTNTGAQICSGLSWVDLRDYSEFAILVLQAALGTGSSGANSIQIVAATNSGGANLTVVKDSGAVNQANSSLNDYTALEATAEEIEQLGQAAGLSLRYVAAQITTDANASISAVTYVRADSKRPTLGLTASVNG